jgi:phytoene dehydrogenase-like protein
MGPCHQPVEHSGRPVRPTIRRPHAGAVNANRDLAPARRGIVPEMVDAVVVGAGPNGLVAANLLADAGWDVLVLEAQPEPGGGVSSAGYLGEGWTTDVCSAFYPLAASSPIFRGLHLEDWGVKWLHSGAVLANPLGGGDAAILRRDAAATAESLEQLCAGDGDAWTRLHSLWSQVGNDVLGAVLTPFPPVKSLARLARTVKVAGGLRLARFASLPVRRLAEEEFTGTGPGLLLAGCAVHADLSPEAAMSSFFGWLLAMLGHEVGFPSVEGGAGQMTAALVRRLESNGGRVECNSRVETVEVKDGRAVAAITAGGNRHPARLAVVADVSAPDLYGGLIGWEHLPSRLRADMSRFQWDWSTVKIDWALKGGVPWDAPEVGTAGTVHIAESLDSLTQYCADVAKGRIPANPFVLLGQLTSVDPTRSPPGTELLYGYTHVPRAVKGDAGDGSVKGTWDDADRDAFVQRVEDRIEEFAPGFKSRVIRRHVLTPAGLEDHDNNLRGGAINGGTAEVHQQLFFRPTPGLGRAETPVQGLFLASSSAHPGGGVHGACGANAARAAITACSPLKRYFVGPALRLAQRSLTAPGTASAPERPSRW